MTVKRFEDLDVWKNAIKLCGKIKTISDSSTLGKNYSLKDQILRSSGSCMDNIAEGFERDGNKEFINFLYISKGSLGETRSQLHQAFDFCHITEIQYNDLIKDFINLSAQFSYFITYLEKSGIAGRKKRNFETLKP